MAQREPERANITDLASRRAARETKGEHSWLVPHLISLIGYAERHGLAEVEHALTQAAEQIAPSLQPEAQQGASTADRLVYLRRPYPEKRD
ncbi:hypothetical protein [Rhodobacter sp. NSM]|uniref:hypothetical protein n=1 Tax=Rhodobacter sp. NSM TaxID=3457501 RepID=UPI003FD4A829